MANKIILKHSSVVTDNNPKLPSKEQLDYGELAVNYADGHETITLKNTSNEIVEFKSKEYFENIITENELVVSESLNSINEDIDILFERVREAEDGIANVQPKLTISDGLSLNGVTLSHADTNTNISKDTSYGPTSAVTQTAKSTVKFKVPQITLDKFGHVKSVTEREISVTDTDTNTESFTITANAQDDDIVVLSGTSGTNAVTYKATHAKKGPSSAFTGSTSTSSISGSGSSGTLYIPKINVDQYGHVNSVSNSTVSITMPTIPTSLKNPNSLTVGTKSYDGSTGITINASDLGLESALKYHGTTTTEISDGSTTKPIVINGTNHTQENGCVVFYGNKEFVWNGSKWEELGNEGNYKVKQTAVTSPSASGNTTAFIDTISQDTNGNITVTKKNVDLSSKVSKSGDTMTGDLTFGTINNADRFIMFDSGDASKAWDWRFGYLGSGSNDANYLVFQSSHGSTASSVKWTNALKLGLQTFDATFAGNILPSTNLTKNLGSNTASFVRTYTRYVDTADTYYLRLCSSGKELMTLNCDSDRIDTTAHILPTATQSYDLGSTSAKWKNVHAKTLYGSVGSPNLSTIDKNHTISYIGGQKEVTSTPTADKIYVGSSSDSDVVSVAKLDGSSTVANVMNLRVHFNSAYYHDIGMYPNNADIYHRAVVNGTALDWKKFVLSDMDNNITGTISNVKISQSSNSVNFPVTFVSTNAPGSSSMFVGGSNNLTINPSTGEAKSKSFTAETKVTVGSSFIQYNSTTGCLEITA